MFKSILITGASSGIGQYLAYAYAKRGIILSIVGRNEERLTQVAEYCRQKGAEVHAGIFDVTDKESLQQWILERDEQVPFDLVIANAGISNFGQAFSVERAERIFAVNVNGVLNTIHAVLPMMRQRKQGHIAIVSSIAGYRGLSFSPPYSASKAAVKAYGEALGGYLRSEGVAVSVICPGYIKTPMTDPLKRRMPFLIDATKAAHAIQKGLAKRKPLIAFPWPMHFAGCLLGLMPTRFVQWLTS